MKKVLSLVLASVLCLSFCACGKNTQNIGAADQNHANNVSENTEANDHVIKFETPVIVAEDEHLRVELVKFYQEYRRWSKGYPYEADADTDGAVLENFVVFKFCNKTDHTLTSYLNDIYLGSDGADFFDIYGSSRIDTAAGKNVLRAFLIQTGENEALESMEELYSMDGDFSIFHKGEDGVMRDNYRLKFSIPKALKAENDSTAPVSDHSEAWNQFRDYLKVHGPITVVTSKTDIGQNQVIIEENAGTIQISHLGEGTSVSGVVRVHGRNTARFELPANVKTVTVQEEYLMEGIDENGNPRKQSASPSYTWDIQNYHSGDEISFPIDYTELDSNGNYIQKTGTLTATKAYAEIADTLSRTLTESGLGITMADLGFVNY